MRAGSKYVGLVGLAAIGIGVGTWAGLNASNKISPPMRERYRADLVSLGLYLKSELRNNSNADVREASERASLQLFDVFSKDYVLVLSPNGSDWVHYESDRSNDRIVAALIPLSVSSRKPNEIILAQQNGWTLRKDFTKKELGTTVPWLYEGIIYGHENERFSFK